MPACRLAWHCQTLPTLSMSQQPSSTRTSPSWRCSSSWIAYTTAVLLAMLACQLSCSAMPRRLLSLDSFPRLISWPPLWRSSLAASSGMLMCLPA